MVKILTDSSPLYTPEEGRKLGFDVLPLCVSIADLDDRGGDGDLLQAAAVEALTADLGQAARQGDLLGI